MNQTIAQAFSNEWQAAKIARKAGELDQAFAHLERAHILGQRHTWLHVRSHVGMLGIAWQRREVREIIGQLTRIVAAGAFSCIWIPEGNTGGANVSATQPMVIPDDLRAILDADRR
ncbi:uncharacterized protein DUF3703 [Tahibacter aquaticus]|uniref:Uncharacterized protein DUF3703 n=1 Tax=Tahibacter aquaticus TaxID=520092 RepID=A0A4R6Z1Z0_9GAMM|nr:DUF3703 domain-containing protein [Tahibacter aquaticus]TDR45587.1 uncharacterized protein DUF3703 [Tahibacter aquaticus]